MAVFVFDNRQFAILCWGTALLVVALFRADLRESVFGLVKTMLSPKVFFVILTMAAFSGAIVYLLYLADAWNLGLLGDSIFWFLGPAFVLLMKTSDAGKDPHFFRRTFASIFAITVLTDFLINVAPFPLWAELSLVPFLVLLGGMSAYTQSRPEHAQVKGCLKVVLGVLGLAFLSYGIWHVVTHASIYTLREFGVPILLTLGLIPYLYVLASVFAYGPMLVWVRLKLSDDALYAYVKRRVLWAAKLRLRTVHRFAKAYPAALVDGMTRADVDRVVRQIKAGGG